MSAPVHPRTAPSLLAPDTAIDLQLHSAYSDGVWDAKELLDHVAAEGFVVVAVTDHDRPDTTAEVQRLAAERGVRAVPATEMTTLWDGEPVDVLCYGFDPARGALGALAAATRRAEWENTEVVYANVLRAGYRFPDAGELLPVSEGQPRHFADIIALLRGHGHADRLRAIVLEAGHRWVGAELAAVVAAAHADGGVCLIAHPGRGAPYVSFDAPHLDRLRAAVQIDGLEVCHPSHPPELTATYFSYARTHHLLVSTSSDSHGTPDQMPIKYRAEMSRHLLARVGIQVR